MVAEEGGLFDVERLPRESIMQQFVLGIMEGKLIEKGLVPYTASLD